MVFVIQDFIVLVVRVHLSRRDLSVLLDTFVPEDLVLLYLAEELITLMLFRNQSAVPVLPGGTVMMD